MELLSLLQSQATQITQEFFSVSEREKECANCFYLTSSSREKCTGFKDPTVFSKSGKGPRKKLKKPMCSSPHAGFNGVFRISKLFFVLELFEFEVGKISKFFDLGGCLTSLFKKLGTSFEKLIFQKPLIIFPI
jgi:hypothetical protein